MIAENLGTSPTGARSSGGPRSRPRPGGDLQLAFDLPATATNSTGTTTKLRGGYYTPPAVAGFLARWAIRQPESNVLEPSAGDGEVVEAALRHIGSGGRIVAVEFDAAEARKLADRVGGRAAVVRGDFFSWYRRELPDGGYDAVIGNPPFIRYQDFVEEHRAHAFELMRAEGLRPSRLTNAWVPFVVAGTRALRRGGRLALVLPAELMQVTYAAELRAYLVRSYDRLTVVTFRKLLFDGIQQETILLLGERGGGKGAKIAFVEADDADDLRSLRLTGPRRSSAVKLDHAREKWTQYYLSSRELGLIRAIERSDEFRPLRDYAEVDVGVVTGRNEFFVLTPSEARTRGLLAQCIPMVGRSAQLRGLLLRRADWNQFVALDEKCYLLALGRVAREKLSPQARAYVASGEARGHHRGFKCAIRLPTWWDVPATWVPDAFLLRQIHDGPRIIVNEAGATSTDTVHRVRTKPGVDAGALALATFNSVTFAFAEIRGRSYGGGVLELEPTEAEGLPVLPPARAGRLKLGEVDKRVRSEGVEAVLADLDRLVLGSAGFSQPEIKTLRGIWKKLATRRSARR